MAEPVRVRRLTDHEGQKLQQIVRRGSTTLHAYLRWHNANAHHRDVLAAERKERARIRSEKGIRWGRRTHTTAA